VDLPHHSYGGCIGKIDGSTIVGLRPGIFGGELVEAAAVDADHDISVGKETVW